jgi:flagellar motor switch/type III secretory pathway protein FliN
MAARRFLIFGATDLSAFLGLSRSLVAAWGEQWFIDGEKDVLVERIEDASCQTLLPSTGGAGEHLLAFVEQGRQAYCVVNDKLVGALCDSAFGPEIVSGQRVVRAHWREHELALAGDILGSLAQTLLGLERRFGYVDRLVDVPLSRLPAGSGWLKLVIAIRSQPLVIWLSQDAVVALRAIPVGNVEAGGLIARSAALVTGDLRVEALAGEANISLRELYELRPGQVVRLDTRFGEPLKLLSKASGKVIAKAWLGSCGGKKALQINAE